MKPTRVVNIRSSTYDVYIGRAGHGEDGYFGNPFVLRHESEREEVLERYAEWLVEHMKRYEFKQAINDLNGKVLGCFCAPRLCHGHVIAAWHAGAQTVSELMSKAKELREEMARSTK